MDELAEALGAERKDLTFLFGPRYLAPIRYVVLFFRTGFVLLKKRPEVIVAQNPPIFLALTCFPYCKLWKKRLFIDHHAVWSTKTLGKGFIGKNIRRLERYASSHVQGNTTPHPAWTRELTELGARNVLTVYDHVGVVPSAKENIREKYSLREKVVLAPHGGHPLEQIEAEIEAMRKIDSVSLIISGPESKMKKRIEKIKLPSNVIYAGFLPKSEYQQLESAVDIGLSVTDEPFTLSHSLLEFASLGIPIISSRQSVVEELFGDSVMYVESSKPKDVELALRTLATDNELLTHYKEKIRNKYKELEMERTISVERLRKMILG